MASRPSEPLLAFLRDAIRKKGTNTAQIATRTGMDRGALKRRLAGEEDLTVDDMIALSKALELTPAELGLAGDAPADADAAAAPPPVPGPDPFGNLSRQVVESGFVLGVDMWFVLDSRQLGGSNIPRAVLEAHREQLPLRMEAKYFPHNKPRFSDDALVCMLSFDALYECTLPWSAFRSVRFDFPAEAPVPAPPPEPPKPARTSGPPHLRVVK